MYTLNVQIGLLFMIALEFIVPTSACNILVSNDNSPCRLHTVNIVLSLDLGRMKLQIMTVLVVNFLKTLMCPKNFIKRNQNFSCNLVYSVVGSVNASIKYGNLKEVYMQFSDQALYSGYDGKIFPYLTPNLSQFNYTTPDEFTLLNNEIKEVAYFHRIEAVVKEPTCLGLTWISYPDCEVFSSTNKTCAQQVLDKQNMNSRSYGLYKPLSLNNYGYNSQTFTEPFSVQVQSFIKFIYCYGAGWQPMAIAIDERNADSNFPDFVSFNKPNYENYAKNWKLMLKSTYSPIRKIRLPAASFTANGQNNVVVSCNKVDSTAGVSIRDILFYSLRSPSRYFEINETVTLELIISLDFNTTLSIDYKDGTNETYSLNGTENLYSGDSWLDENFDYSEPQPSSSNRRFLILHSPFEKNGIVDQIELFAFSKGYIGIDTWFFPYCYLNSLVGIQCAAYVQAYYQSYSKMPDYKAKTFLYSYFIEEGYNLINEFADMFVDGYSLILVYEDFKASLFTYNRQNSNRSELYQGIDDLIQYSSNINNQSVLIKVRYNSIQKYQFTKNYTNYGTYNVNITSRDGDIKQVVPLQINYRALLKCTKSGVEVNQLYQCETRSASTNPATLILNDGNGTNATFIANGVDKRQTSPFSSNDKVGYTHYTYEVVIRNSEFAQDSLIESIEIEVLRPDYLTIYLVTCYECYLHSKSSQSCMDYFISTTIADCTTEYIVNGYYVDSGRNLITSLYAPIVTAKKGNFLKVVPGNVIVAIKNVSSSQKDFCPINQQFFDGSLLLNVNYIPFEKFTFASAYPFPGTYKMSLLMEEKNLTVTSQTMTVGQSAFGYVNCSTLYVKTNEPMTCDIQASSSLPMLIKGNFDDNSGVITFNVTETEYNFTGSTSSLTMYNKHEVAIGTIEAASTEFPEDGNLLNLEFFMHNKSSYLSIFLVNCDPCYYQTTGLSCFEYMVQTYTNLNLCQTTYLNGNYRDYGYNSIDIANTRIKRGNYLRFTGPIIFAIEDSTSITGLETAHPDFYATLPQKKVDLKPGFISRLNLKANYISMQPFNRSLAYNSTRDNYIDKHNINLKGQSRYASLSINTNLAIEVIQYLNSEISCPNRFVQIKQKFSCTQKVVSSHDTMLSIDSGDSYFPSQKEYLLTEFWISYAGKAINNDNNYYYYDSVTGENVLKHTVIQKDGVLTSIELLTGWGNKMDLDLISCASSIQDVFNQTQIYQTNCTSQNCTICKSTSVLKSFQPVNGYQKYKVPSDRIIHLFKGNFFVLRKKANESLRSFFDRNNGDLYIRMNYVSYQIQPFSVTYNKVGNYSLNSTVFANSSFPQLFNITTQLVQVIPELKIFMSCSAFISNTVIKETVNCLFKIISSIPVVIQLDYGDGSPNDFVPVNDVFFDTSGPLIPPKVINTLTNDGLVDSGVGTFLLRQTELVRNGSIQSVEIFALSSGVVDLYLVNCSAFCTSKNCPDLITQMFISQSTSFSAQDSFETCPRGCTNVTLLRNYSLTFGYNLIYDFEAQLPIQADEHQFLIISNTMLNGASIASKKVNSSSDADVYWCSLQKSQSLNPPPSSYINLLVTVNYMSLIKLDVVRDYFYASTYNIYAEIQGYQANANQDIPLDREAQIYTPICDDTILFIQNRANSSSSALSVTWVNNTRTLI